MTLMPTLPGNAEAKQTVEPFAAFIKAVAAPTTGNGSIKAVTSQDHLVDARSTNRWLPVKTSGHDQAALNLGRSHPVVLATTVVDFRFAEVLI